MKKLIKISTFLTFIFMFCTFLCSGLTFSQTSTFGSFQMPTELELREYQELEHGIASSVQTESNDFFEFEQTDTIPSQTYTVVLDAGHGGTDPGSIGYKTKVKESDLNLKLVKMLEKKLESAGINVVLTRTSDKALAEGRGKAFKKQDMANRKELIKNVRPNMVISLHQNSSNNHGYRGAQVFYDKTSEISKQIADLIQKEFNSSLLDGKKYPSPGDYYMLKCTTAPSVIVECGFLSNADEEQLLLSNSHQEKIINAIYLGIINFLQIK